MFGCVRTAVCVWLCVRMLIVFVQAYAFAMLGGGGSTKSLHVRSKWG